MSTTLFFPVTSDNSESSELITWLYQGGNCIDFFQGPPYWRTARKYKSESTSRDLLRSVFIMIPLFFISFVLGYFIFPPPTFWTRCWLPQVSFFPERSWESDGQLPVHRWPASCFWSLPILFYKNITLLRWRHLSLFYLERDTATTNNRSITD